MLTLVRALFIATIFLCGGNVMAAELGVAAPEFNLELLNTKSSISLAAFKEHVVLIDFWASWCVPCRESLPLYNKLRQEFVEHGFEILAINLDEQREDAQRFVQQHPVDYPILYDAEGGVAKRYALPGMPTSYLIDREGVVRKRTVGFSGKDYDALRAAIKQLLDDNHAP